MRQIFLLSWIALGAMLSVNLPVVSQEIAPDIRDNNKDSILEQFKKGDKNTLIFGVRADSYPISYKESDSWRGFCVELAGILKDELGKLQGIEPNQNSIKIVYKDISPIEIEKERFDILRNKEIDIECGPNSIPGKVSEDIFFHPRYHNIIFSKPFFVTGTRLLIKKDQRDNVNKNPLFEGELVGVMKNTTTYLVLKNVYRLAHLKSPNPPTRKNGIEYLKAESVIAYATDSLILEAELERKKYLDNPDNYYLYPENNFLSIEPYGLAFHNSEKEWRNFVNKVLQTPGVERIIEELLENKYDSISKLIKREEDDTRYLETVELASKVLSIILVVTILVALIWLIRYLGLKAQTAEIIFHKEEEFDWNAFIYAFKMVQVEDKVVLLAISELSMKDNSDLSFKVDLCKSKLKKEEFIAQFRYKYAFALEDVKKHYKLGIKEAQSHGQSLKNFQTQIKTLNDLIDWLSINIEANFMTNNVAVNRPGVNIKKSYTGDTKVSENTGDQFNQSVSGNDNITAQGKSSTFNQSQVSQSADEQITPTEVVEMLAHLEEKIQSLTALSEVNREKSIKHLETAKVEVQESEPNKDSIANSLKRVNETLNEAGKTTKEVKELVNELFPTVTKVAGYLGYAAGTIWSMLP